MINTKYLNLWDSTLKALSEFDWNEDDILYGMIQGWKMSPVKFKEIALKTTYNPGYGINEIPTSLTVVCKKGILVWHEYDGSECWRVINLIPRGNFMADSFKNLRQYDDYESKWEF